jgi:hypothetical protein
MQSRWMGLEAIHSSMSVQQVASIEPDFWLHTIKSSLSIDCGNKLLCHQSPAKCSHCHKMAALSVIATMRMLVVSSGNKSLNKIYLEPLCVPESGILRNMVCNMVSCSQIITLQGLV